MNISGTDCIAEEEITEPAGTQYSSLTTPEANLHLVPSDSESKEKENNKKKRIMEVE